MRGYEIELRDEPVILGQVKSPVNMRTGKPAFFLTIILLMTTATSAFAQRFDLFYTCVDSAVGKDRISRLQPKSGYVSVDIDEQVIVFHNLKDSQIVEFKKPEYKERDHEWRLTLPDRDAGDSWDGYTLQLDYTNQPLSLERRFTMTSESKYTTTLKMGYYSYPSFDLSKEMFATRKVLPAKGGAVPDIRNDDYAWYTDILNTTKKGGYANISTRGDELVFEESEMGVAAGMSGFTMKIDRESLTMISKPKYHGLYFNAVNANDTTTRYEVFYGLNYHLDRADPLMEILTYKNDVFTQMVIYGYSHFELFSERNYKPPLPVIVSGCQRCKGTGKVVSTEICRRCHGRGHQKSTVYRSSDQLVKTEIHGDGSRTNTYLKQGFSSTVYDCDLCKGTGYKLITCTACDGTGKIETRGAR